VVFDAGTEDSDGEAAMVEGGLVGGGIDAKGEAGDDGVAGGDEGWDDGFGGFGAVWGGFASANDCETG